MLVNLRNVLPKLLKKNKTTGKKIIDFFKRNKEASNKISKSISNQQSKVNVLKNKASQLQKNLKSGKVPISKREIFDKQVALTDFQLKIEKLKLFNQKSMADITNKVSQGQLNTNALNKLISENAKMGRDNAKMVSKLYKNYKYISRSEMDRLLKYNQELLTKYNNLAKSQAKQIQNVEKVISNVA